MTMIVNVTMSDQLHQSPGHRNRFRMARLGRFGTVLCFADSCWNLMMFDMSHANNCKSSQEWSNSSPSGIPSTIPNGQIGSTLQSIIIFLIPYGVSWSLTYRMPIIVNAVKNGQDHHPSGHKNRFWMARFGQFSKVFSFLIPCGNPWSLTCCMPIIVNAAKNDQIHHSPGNRNRFRMARLGQSCKALSFWIAVGIPWSLTCRMPITVNVPKWGQIHNSPGHREPVPGTQMWPVWHAMVLDEPMMKFHEVWHAACLESSNLIWRHSSGLPESVPGSWPCPISPIMFRSFELAMLQMFINNIAK